MPRQRILRAAAAAAARAVAVLTAPGHVRRASAEGAVFGDDRGEDRLPPLPEGGWGGRSKAAPPVRALPIPLRDRRRGLRGGAREAPQARLRPRAAMESARKAC